MKADRHGPDPRKRRVHFAFRLAPLLILAAVLIGSRPLVDWAVGALSVRRVARAWRIPATPEVRDLIRAALIDTRTPRPAATLRPARDPSIAPDESAPFSARYSHADLRAEGLIRITLFVSDPDLRPRLQDWIASAMKARPDLNIQLKTTRNEFLEALGRDDMVLFWGHANLGRGLHFDPAPDSPRELALAPPVLVLPRDETKPDDVILADLPDDRVQIRGYHDPELDRLEIRCKSLWLLGCRTEMYYRDWFRTHAPNTDLVTTLCALDTLADTRRVLQTLLLALDERRSVQDILAVLNHNREFARLQGYREEIHRYNRKADPPAALYYAEDRPPAL